MENNQLMILEAEKKQAEIRITQIINTIRNTLDNLEAKIENKSHLYESDGLQGNGVYLDNYIVKMVAYQRAIDMFENYLESESE